MKNSFPTRRSSDLVAGEGEGKAGSGSEAEDELVVADDLLLQQGIKLRLAGGQSGLAVGRSLLGGEQVAIERFDRGQRLAIRHPAIGVIAVNRAAAVVARGHMGEHRSEEHTSELQSLMLLSYAVYCLKKKTQIHTYY